MISSLHTSLSKAYTWLLMTWATREGRIMLAVVGAMLLRLCFLISTLAGGLSPLFQRAADRSVAHNVDWFYLGLYSLISVGLVCWYAVRWRRKLY